MDKEYPSRPSNKEIIKLQEEISKNKFSKYKPEKLRLLAKLQEKYNNDMGKYQKELNLYIKEEREKEKESNNRLLSEFYKKYDLSEIDINNKIFQKLYYIAYDIGHSSGIESVLSYMDDFIEIYFLYKSEIQRKFNE